MSTERCLISEDVVNRARRMALSGDVADHIFADTQASGLRLRVRKRNASWELKCGTRTLCIGRLNRMFAKEARVRAGIGRDLLIGGVDPNPFFAARLAGLSEAEARRIAHEKHGTLLPPGKENGPVWTLDELMRRYVADYVSQEKLGKNKALKPPSDHTVADVERAFARPAFDSIRNLTLDALNAKLLAAAGATIQKSVTARQREKALAYVKGALKWASGLDEPPAGLSDEWWKKVKNPQSAPVRPQNTLLAEDVGRLLAIAELNRVAAGRSIDKETSPITLCMLWWLVVTAQRTTASSLVLKRHVADHRQRRWSGWGIVSYPAENMKSRRFHALPLPPLAMAVVERAREATETIGRRDSEWLFPAVRTASKTRGRCDLGATDRAVDQLIRRLRGKDEMSRQTNAPDLLVGLPHFTPHNIRHSFSTWLGGNTTVVGGAASAVFDHSVATPDDKEFRRSAMLDVYDKSHRLPLKAQALSPWCFSVYLRYEEALEELMANDPRYAGAKPWRFVLKEGILLKPWAHDDDGFSRMR